MAIIIAVLLVFLLGGIGIIIRILRSNQEHLCKLDTVQTPQKYLRLKNPIEQKGLDVRIVPKMYLDYKINIQYISDQLNLAHQENRSISNKLERKNDELQRKNEEVIRLNERLRITSNQKGYIR